MADVFEDRRDLDSERQKLWKLIADTPWLDWLLLTKRPELMNELTPMTWDEAWPKNVWAGTTAENQEWAEKRIPHLLKVPAYIRFLSIEPMLGPVSLLGTYLHSKECKCAQCDEGIDWIIVGAESGAGARVMDMNWVRAMRDQCQAAGIDFFLKQFVEDKGMSKYETPELDGKKWTEVPTSPMLAVV